MRKLLFSLFLGITPLAQAAAMQTPAEVIVEAGRLSADEPAAALRLIRGLGRFETRPVRALSLEIYVLTDQNDFAAALKCADQAVQLHPDEASLWLAQGYANRRAGRAGIALLSYQHVLMLEPANRDALQGQVLAFSDSANATLAWQLADASPELFNEATRTRLRHAYAVELLKLHRGESDSRKSRYALLDEGIALMRENTHPDRGQRADLLEALNERGLHAEVVATYEANPQIAPWAERPVAASYSALGRFREATLVLEDAHRRDAKDLPTTYALAYSYADQKRFADAQRLLGEVVTSLGSPKHAEMPFIRQFQAQLDLWAGNLPAADVRIRTGLASYPNHNGLKQARAAWLQASGQRTEAREQLKVVDALAPDATDTKVALLELSSPADARATGESLSALAEARPNDERALKAAREYARSQKGYDYSSLSFGADRDSRSVSVDDEVASPAFGPFATRLAGEVRLLRDTLKTGSVVQGQQRLGVDQPLGDDATASVSVVRSHFGHLGAAFRVKDLALGGVSLTVKASTLDAEVPARVAGLNVTGKSASAELSSLLPFDTKGGLTVSRQNLSDGNHRASFSGSLAGNLSAWGNLRPNWVTRAGYDQASRSDVSYFSPHQSAWSEVEMGLSAPSWNVAGSAYLDLRPFVSLGSFAQTGYAVMATASVGLRAHWPLTPQISVDAEMKSVHRPYDGQYSTLTSGQVSLFVRLP